MWNIGQYVCFDAPHQNRILQSPPIVPPKNRPLTVALPVGCRGHVDLEMVSASPNLTAHEDRNP